jgi:hypothetical protein
MPQTPTAATKLALRLVAVRYQQLSAEITELDRHLHRLVAAAASASQRSCWRSVPRARRKRTTSDAAPTTRPATVREKPVTMATSMAPGQRRDGDRLM